MVPNHVKVGLIQEHQDECQLFNKMVKELGLDPNLVKRVIALWLGLEDYGYQEFTRSIVRQDDRTIAHFFDHGLAILECTEAGAKPVDRASELWKYYDERESIRKRFGKILTTLCENIFGEEEALEVVKRGSRWVVKDEARPFGEGSSEQGAPDMPEVLEEGDSLGWLHLESDLNPDAPPYQPVITREMFVAFRFGYPLNELEIANHFNAWFSGPVVEHVCVISPPPGYSPLCALVAFREASVVAMFLGGGLFSRLTTADGREMWASAYRQRFESFD